MSKTRYSEEFKKEAARLIIIDGMSVSDVSKKLGTSPAQLYKWRDAHLDSLSAGAVAAGQASPKEMAAELDSLRKQLRKAERVNEILKKNGELLFKGRDMTFEFIEKHRSLYDVIEMCEALGVSTSGFYRWESSEPSRSRSEDESFKEKILEIHDQVVGDYGHRPVYRHLLEDGVGCGRDRTLRLMNELELSGKQSKGYKPQGTDSAHDFGYSPNLLKELGATSRCDEVWVTDTTYLRVGKRWMYLATVMDLHSRRILGWSVSPSNDTALILEALKAAVATRGSIVPGIIHHSDRGSTYASYAYQNHLFALGMKSSMSAKGNCYDNAAKESFYGRFKTGSVRERVFFDESELRRHVFLYIEMFYNRFRKHSSIGYKNPIQFERDFFAPHGGQSKERYLYQDQTN